MVKKNKLVIAVILIALVAFMLFGGGRTQTKTFKGINNGVSVEAVIVNNVNQDTFTIVAHETNDEYVRVENNYPTSYLSLNTSIDNTAGDSEYTITSIDAENDGTIDILGPPGCGTGYGDLDNIWQQRLTNEGGTIVIPPGEMYPSDGSFVESCWLDLGDIDAQPPNVVTFNITVNGFYLDAQGQEVPAVKSGHIKLRIIEEQCSDGTTSDPNIVSSDNTDYCSTQTPATPEEAGQYCKVSATGAAELVDNAQTCGCCYHVAQNPLDTSCGYEPVGGTGSVCVVAVSCTDNDGDNYYVESSGCDGEIGFLGHNDCVDSNANIHPGIAGPHCGCPENPQGSETDCGDGFDNDCDGLVDCDDVSDCGGDSDNDGVCDLADNCVDFPNGPLLGTCIETVTKGLQSTSSPVFCTQNSDCNEGGGYYCEKTQADTWPVLFTNGIGDVCDCEGNFNIDSDVDGSDQALYNADSGRNTFNNPCTEENPCNGDFDCDQDVDGTDQSLFNSDLNRGFFSACPVPTMTLWPSNILCDYPATPEPTTIFLEEFETGWGCYITGTTRPSSSHGCSANNPYGNFNGCDDTDSDAGYRFCSSDDEYTRSRGLQMTDWVTWNQNRGLWYSFDPRPYTEITVKGYNSAASNDNANEFCIIWVKDSDSWATIYKCANKGANAVPSGCAADDTTPEPSDFRSFNVDLSTLPGIDITDPVLEVHIGADQSGNADYCWWDDIEIIGWAIP